MGMNETPPQAPNLAEVYEGFLAPHLFAPWARDLVARAQPRLGERVFDVACGTGIVVRAVLPVVGSTGRVAGVDFSPAMLAVARTPSQALLGKLDSHHVGTDWPNKLVGVYPHVRVYAELQIRFLGVHTVILGEPPHHTDGGSVQGPFHAACVLRRVHLYEALRCLYAHYTGDSLLLDDPTPGPHFRRRFVGDGCVLGVGLRRVGAAEEEQSPVMVKIGRA